jgi:hypothetical protein
MPFNFIISVSRDLPWINAAQRLGASRPPGDFEPGARNRWYGEIGQAFYDFPVMLGP